MSDAAAPVVHTPDGRVAGVRLDGGICRFLGLPYAAPPVGVLRLRSPRPPRPWAGLRDASHAAPASLQVLEGHHTWLNEPIGRSSEDCLGLNVWTPALDGAAPVLLFVHGGQTRCGHGAAPVLDGSALARRGLVVVTINYRLGALGGLAHPELQDDETGHCANWGLQDMLAALAWVQRGIACFGGDPARVTLAGQSSGAAHAALIVQHRLGHGHYAGLILQSPPLFRPPMYVALDDAAAYTEALAATLGCRVAALRDLDGRALQQAEQAFASSPELLARLGRPRTSPVLDGRLIRQWSIDAPPPAVPLLAGWTRTESDFWFDLDDGAGRRLAPQRPPQTPADALAATARLLALHHAFDQSPSAQAVLDAHAAAGATPDAWRQIYTDLVFRAPILQLLARTARSGVPAWGYAFSHPVASAQGGSPHASDVPFVFGTQGQPHLAAKLGDAGRAAATSAAMGLAWTAFVRDGRAPWPAFDPDRPAVQAFHDGGHCEALPVDRDALERLWPGYAWATAASTRPEPVPVS
ncbi:MAG: carboxylesterase family protein [Rubrivivax sp.]